MPYPKEGANARGYTYRWQQASKRFLQEHPMCMCVDCGEEKLAATVVDHITPHKGNQTLFWDENNWQAMSKRCHDIKTATEDRGGKRAVKIGIDGWPVSTS